MALANFIEGKVDESLTEDGVPKWMVEDSDFIDGYTNATKKVEYNSNSGFGVSPGTRPNTRGILFWNEPFIIRGKDRKDICLLVMDTQGLWDYETTNEFNVCVFGLSAVLSSFLIFNSKNSLNMDQLKLFSNLSEFSKGVASHLKAFQQLNFLIRDFADYNPDIDDRTKVKEHSRNLLNLWMDMEQTKKEVERIDNCFEQFDVVCFPKPGDIDAANYDGSIKKIKPLFMCILSDYIVRIVKEIQPRRINGDELTVEAFAQ